jgi:hypothetical protein
MKGEEIPHSPEFLRNNRLRVDTPLPLRLCLCCGTQGQPMPAAAARRRLPADAAARATVPGEPRRARAVIAPCAPGPPAGVGAARSRVPGPLPPGERGPPPPPPADASRCPRRDRRRHCRVCGWSPRGAWAPGAGWGAVSASRRPAGAAQPARRTWREAAHSWAGGAQGPSARRATPHPVGPAFCPGGCAAPERAAQTRAPPSSPARGPLHGADTTHGLCLRGIAQRDWGGCRTPARPMA